MAGYSQTTIVGNVGRDPVFKYTQSGVGVADFSVAVTTKFTSNKVSTEKTEWYRVTAWRELAEIVNQFVRKGGQVLVVGEISSSAYIDKAGEAKSNLELTASKIQLLGKRENANAQRGNGKRASEDDISDIPF